MIKIEDFAPIKTLGDQVKIINRQLHAAGFGRLCYLKEDNPSDPLRGATKIVIEEHLYALVDFKKLLALSVCNMQGEIVWERK